jgi:hypothetical protein
VTNNLERVMAFGEGELEEKIKGNVVEGDRCTKFFHRVANYKGEEAIPFSNWWLITQLVQCTLYSYTTTWSLSGLVGTPSWLVSRLTPLGVGLGGQLVGETL